MVSKRRFWKELSIDFSIVAIEVDALCFYAPQTKILDWATKYEMRAFYWFVVYSYLKTSTHIIKKRSIAQRPVQLEHEMQSLRGARMLVVFCKPILAMLLQSHVGNNISETYPRRIGQGLNDASCMLSSMRSSLMGLPNQAWVSLENVVSHIVTKTSSDCSHAASRMFVVCWFFFGKPILAMMLQRHRLIAHVGNNICAPYPRLIL